MVAADPLAFWMSQLRLSFLQAAARAVGSELTQRGEDVVSGRMMPTLAPLPSKAPLLLELLLLELLPPAGAEEFVVDFLLEEHALTASVAAAPTTIRPSALLRMGSAAFRDMRRRRRSRCDPLNVVGGNISLN
jgi:hypothetical protein